MRATGDDVRVLAWGAAGGGVDDFDRVVAAHPDSEPSTAIAPVKPLYYTSGTTGLPKGVELPEQLFPLGDAMVEHVRLVTASRIRPPGKHLTVAPMHHTGPIAGVRGLMAGTPLVIMPKAPNLPAATLASDGTVVLFGVPSNA